jgi:nucleotide-binding universal stress UspA family protein
MYEDILFPYDGSEGAASVLHHASEIAHWADATIHVLFVADTARDSVTVVETEVVDALEEKGEEIANDAARTLDSLGVDYETEVLQGNPAPMIAEYADTNDHDLITMPTHARAGVSRYLIGSVTEKLVRLAPTPVLTARMDADERLSFPYENILIPTDGSVAATNAARKGISLAASLDATVHVVSAVEQVSPAVEVLHADTGKENERAATEAADDVATEAEARGLTAVRHVENGAPVEVILDRIDSVDAHAVFMGTSGRRGTDRILLGSVAEKTVRSAPVPVVTVGDGETPD